MTVTETNTLKSQSEGTATTLSLIGAVATTIANFGTAILVTRASTAFAGIFFTATALVSIIGNASSLGSMTGVVYFAPNGLDGAGRPINIRPILRVALLPVICLSTALGFAVAFLAPTLTSWMGAELSLQHTELIRYSAIAIPGWAILLVLLGATRALGTMTPHVGINQIFKPLLQIILLSLVFIFSTEEVPDARLVALAWAFPIIISAALAFAATAKLGGLSSNGSKSVSSKEFWSYTRPRSASVALQSLLERVDVIIVSGLTNDAIAGIYGSISRYVTAGNYLIFSIAQATSPSLRRAIANERLDTAQELLKKITTWMVLIAWPYFVLLAFKSEGATRLLDPALVDGKTTLTLLAIGMTVSAFAGPIDMALLMLGRSKRSLFSTAAAVTANIGLAFMLIPQYGLIGAGVAWIVAVIIQNGLNTYFVYTKSKLHSTSKATLIAAFGATACFGIPGLLTSQTLPQMLVSGFVGLLAYSAWVVYFASHLHLGGPRDKLLTRLSLGRN